MSDLSRKQLLGAESGHAEESLQRWLQLTGSKDLRRNLYELLKGKPEYDWITPVLEVTVDQYAGQQVDIEFAPGSTNGRYTNSFNPGLISENLLVGSELINRAFNIRTDIFGLESQAIAMALQYLYEDDQREDAFVLARIEVKRNAFQLGEEPGEGLRALENQRSIQKNLQQARLLAHLTSGGALNFAERVKPLRERYVRHVQEAFSRLRAAHTGLVDMVHPPGKKNWDPVPNVPVSSVDFISRMLGWCDTTRARFARAMQEEFIVVVPVSLAFAIGQEALHRAMHSLDQKNVFTVDPDIPYHLRNRIGNARPVAVVGVDALIRLGSAATDSKGIDEKSAYQFTIKQEKRNEARRLEQQLSARLVIGPPEHNQGQSKWKYQPIILESVPLRREGPTKDLSFFDAPFARVGFEGKWTVEIPAFLRGAVELGWKQFLVDLNPDANAYQKAIGAAWMTEGKFVDVELLFKVACR